MDKIDADSIIWVVLDYEESENAFKKIFCEYEIYSEDPRPNAPPIPSGGKASWIDNDTAIQIVWDPEFRREDFRSLHVVAQLRFHLDVPLVEEDPLVCDHANLGRIRFSLRNHARLLALSSVALVDAKAVSHLESCLVERHPDDSSALDI